MRKGENKKLFEYDEMIHLLKIDKNLSHRCLHISSRNEFIQYFFILFNLIEN